MAEAKKETKKTKRPTAEKRNLQNQKHRLINKGYKSQVRTAIRSLHDLLEKKDSAQAAQKLQDVYSILDKCVKKGVFKLNKASRTKSRLAAKVAAS